MLTRTSLRNFATTSLTVVNSVARQQFLTTYRGAEATLDYERKGKIIKFTATNVPEAFQGKGVGKLLAQHAFDHAKSEKLDVIIKCHFLEKYYKNHKGRYASLRVRIELDD